jgi:hypothetical protein
LKVRDKEETEQGIRRDKRGTVKGKLRDYEDTGEAL